MGAAGRQEGDGDLAALMVASQGGDRAAYRRLLRACDPLIRRAARRAGVGADRVDDVVQDTLLTLHDARQTYDPTRSFEAWLSVIARRRAIDVLRRSGRVHRREVHDPHAFEAEPAESADALGTVEASEDAAALHRAIAGLSPPQREAVERLALREQSLAEASAATGRTPGALKVNLHRAIKALRGRLVGDGTVAGEPPGGDRRV